jgi:hypothetical protein
MSIKYHPNPTSVSPWAVYLQNGQLYFQTVGWHAIQSEPPNLSDAVIAFYHIIYGLDTNGDIFRWQGGSSWAKDNDAKNVASLTSDAAGNLYCVNQNGQVYVKYSPSANWHLWDENIPGQAGDVPQIWKYTVKEGDWLWKIVRIEYGTNDPTTISNYVQQIEDLNPVPDTTNCVVPWDGDWDHLCIGMVLKMPPK